MQSEAAQKLSIPRPVDSKGRADPFRGIAEAIQGIIWMCNSEGRFSYVSPRWAEYTGSNSLPGPGRTGLGFIHPDDVTAGKQVWQRASKSGQSFETQVRLRRHDGVFRWHQVRGVPERNGRNRVVRWVGACIDIEELVRVQNEAASKHANLSLAREELERTV